MENIIEGSDISNLESIGINNIIINCKFIGDGIIIGNNCTLKNVIIGEKTNITDSFIEDSLIGKACKIGPYSRLRQNCNIGDECKIGNFVEIKNSQLGNGVKSCHLSYIGDAIIGERTNVGCGVVFANYNGKVKNMTIVGKDCFIGSNSTLIAPVKIANESYICAGTTITKSTEEGDFVIGRVKAETKKKYSYYKRNHLK
ncbi:MAG: DapH/DapD/GlmU-related protein [Christensenellales bacterium]